MAEENKLWLVVLVEFKGNHEKQYEYFMSVPLQTDGKPSMPFYPKIDDYAVVQTASGTPSVAKVVAVRELKDVSDKCNNVALFLIPRKELKWMSENYLKAALAAKEIALDPLAGLL